MDVEEGGMCIMEWGAENKTGTLGTKLHQIKVLLIPVGIQIILKCILKVTDLCGLLIQPGCGRHSRGSAHRCHGYAGPGSAADGQEAGHCEEVTNCGDFR